MPPFSSASFSMPSRANFQHYSLPIFTGDNFSGYPPGFKARKYKTSDGREHLGTRPIPLLAAEALL